MANGERSQVKVLTPRHLFENPAILTCLSGRVDGFVCEEEQQRGADDDAEQAALRREEQRVSPGGGHRHPGAQLRLAPGDEVRHLEVHAPPDACEQSKRRMFVKGFLTLVPSTSKTDVDSSILMSTSKFTLTPKGGVKNGPDHELLSHWLLSMSKTAEF